MPDADLAIYAVRGVGEVTAGANLADLLAEAATASGGPGILDGDVIVVTSKVVSKAEGQVVALDDAPDAKVRLVDSQSARILRRRGDLLITETTHGFVCANAGIDLSNIDEGMAVLLPEDSDRSARRLRADLRRRLGVEIGIVISDTFGRTWRNGVTDVAIGCAGVAGIIDLRGTLDAGGRLLEATEVCVVDELAAAGELVMRKATGIPAVIIRGVASEWLRDGSVRDEIVRAPGQDLFR